MASTSSATQLGMLILRFGVGAVFAFRGYPLLTAGVDKWRQLGQEAMSPLEVTFGYPVWGFLGVASEVVGGGLIALGLFVRPSALFLLITMAIVTYMQVDQGQEWQDLSFQLGMTLAVLSLLVGGGGDFSLGQAFKPLDGKWYR